MGTRSITRVFSDNVLLVTIYRQMDGYPSGHGKALGEFICSGKFVNGLGMRSTKLVFNGAGCFAAALIAHLKKGPGSIYVITPDAEDEEWNYDIHVSFDHVSFEGGCSITVRGDRTYLAKSPKAFLAWCKKHGG